MPWFETSYRMNWHDLKAVFEGEDLGSVQRWMIKVRKRIPVLEMINSTYSWFMLRWIKATSLLIPAALRNLSDKHTNSDFIVIIFHKDFTRSETCLNGGVLTASKPCFYVCAPQMLWCHLKAILLCCAEVPFQVLVLSRHCLQPGRKGWQTWEWCFRCTDIQAIPKWRSWHSNRLIRCLVYVKSTGKPYHEFLAVSLPEAGGSPAVRARGGVTRTSKSTNLPNSHEHPQDPLKAVHTFSKWSASLRCWTCCFTGFHDPEFLFCQAVNNCTQLTLRVLVIAKPTLARAIPVQKGE